MGKPPAFQTYAADYYMDTADWTVEEMGIYQRLLLNQWVNIDLPSDTKRLARIAGCSQNKFNKGWLLVSKKFTTLDNLRLQNLRLEEERKKQLNYSESRREQANKRWEKDDAHAHAHAMHSECTAHALQSSSSSSYKKKEVYSEIFESLWKTYPARNGNKVGKPEAFTQFNNILPEEYEPLKRAINKYATSCKKTDTLVRDMARFLKKDYWRDWVDKEKDLDEQLAEYCAGPPKLTEHELNRQLKEDGIL